MSFEIPIILILLAANFLWLLVGYSTGHKEGLREGWHRGRAVNRQEFWQE